jgi:signal transduction histidine kinase/ActR/RegA family two-component response regulator
MNGNGGSDPERRILILAPTVRDAALTCQALEREHIPCVICTDLETMCSLLEGGAGALLLPEEAIGPERPTALLEILHRQPAWSDLPILLLARPGADTVELAQAMDLLGNVTVVERPTRMSALVSAVRSALRARQRQYQIREHLEERARAERALREADRRKDEFLAILAHELRNPLAPLRNSLHVLRANADASGSVGATVGMMERQVNQMVRLVDDLLEISRITRGKIELRREPVELSFVVQSAIETCRPLVEAGRHRLDVDLPAEMIVVDADPVRLAQVLTNLLNNAAKYTDHGGIIGLSVRTAPGRVSIEVSDTGRGIPPEMLPRVFDLFTQVDGKSHRAQGGLGIGLTLARTLVEMHGGVIEAHSEGVGRGSRFVVELPRLEHASRPPVAAPPGESADFLRHRRVLVVDDNRDAADSMCLVLTLLGAEVRVAYSGMEALEATASWHPSVVLLDIGMAGMDGYEVARRIRRQPDLADVHLVALTGWGQEKDRKESIEAGIDRHVTKPIDVDALKTLLGSLLRAPRASMSL